MRELGFAGEGEDLSLFRDVPAEVMSVIEKSLELRGYGDGQQVFALGDASDEILFIRSGAVKISLPTKDGGHHALATFVKWDFFGEMAFLDRDRRSADAIADGGAEVYAFSYSRFREISYGFPDAGAIVFARIAKELSHRLRLNNIELRALEEG